MTETPNTTCRPVSLSIPDYILEQLEKTAKQQKRSKSNLATIILERELAKINSNRNSAVL